MRVGLLLNHTPLVALANSYDEVRYTACFDLYPDRPADVPVTRNSPDAPYSRYVFVPNAAPICYWSSELLFQGAAAAIYHAQETLTHVRSFSVRWIGALKFLAFVVLWAAFTLAWLRRGEIWSALANGLILPLVIADPANTIYLNTFYAEWTALLALYALLGMILLAHDRAPSRRIFVALALAAFALALSKIQHLLLPTVCALIVLLIGRLRQRRWPWQGQALLLGALFGLGVQVMQLQRDSDAIRAIDQFNRADVTFTGLLPNASDPQATARDLGLAPECLRFIGKSAWQMSDWPVSVCPQLDNVTRRRELATLMHEPGIAWRLWWNGVLHLEPWMAPGLGKVEGGDFEALPKEFFTFSNMFTAWPVLRVPLLAGPLCMWIGLFWRRRWQSHARLFLFSAVVTGVMLATLTITVLGDGLADTSKQGHLITNAALAWWVCIPALMLGRRLTHRRRTSGVVNTIDLDQQFATADITAQQ